LDFNNRIDILVGEKKSTSSPEPQLSEATKNKQTTATMLFELITIAAQLAQADMAMAQVKDGVPEDPEAKRWHDISIQALHTSRNMLSEKQSSCLNQLSALQGGTSGVAALKKETEKKSEAKSTWESWTAADIDACPEFVPPPPGLAEGNWSTNVEDASTGSLRQDLEILRNAQPETVFIVRKIKKLGFESPHLLKQHFGQYGPVKEILVAHSHVKPTPQRPNGRVRPAALGFVVMASPKGVKNAFEAGSMQDINGHLIELKNFESFDNYYAGEENLPVES